MKKWSVAFATGCFLGGGEDIGVCHNAINSSTVNRLHVICKYHA
jgi:hypothetical protein